MAKQTKKGSNGTTSQNGKNAKRAFTLTTEVHEIFEGVDTLVLEPEEETTEIELTLVEPVETSVETLDNSEVTELPGVEATTEVQPETAIEVVNEAIAETTIVEATTELQPEMVTVEVPETLTETTISEEVTERPDVVEHVELQPETLVETIVAPEATETPVVENGIALQPEIVTEEPIVTSDAPTEGADAKDNTTNDANANVITTDGAITDAETINTIGESETKPPVTGKTPPLKKQAPKPPVAKEKKQSPKKVTDETKEEIAKEKKVTLAGTGYHYYRNWLRDFLRNHGAPSARFTKSAENYDGTISVVESEKEKGVLALGQWVIDNPGIKEMFWDVNK